jgi:hypothetical protein
MIARARRILKPVPVLLLLAACEGRSPSPTGPSAPSSFLTGTWTGTVTIQVNPGDPGAQPPTSGPITLHSTSFRKRIYKRSGRPFAPSMHGCLSPQPQAPR